MNRKVFQSGLCLLLVGLLGSCSNDRADEPSGNEARSEVVDESETNDDNAAGSTVIDEWWGIELLTKEQLAERGLTWVDFDETNYRDPILTPSMTTYEVPASGAQLSLDFLTATNVYYVIKSDSERGIWEQYLRGEVHQFYESETAHMHMEMCEGPLCLDYYVMVFYPYDVTDFHGLTFSHTDPMSLVVDVAGNPGEEERWYEIGLLRTCYQPGGGWLGASHAYYAADASVFIHQAADPNSGVHDVKI